MKGRVLVVFDGRAALDGLVRASLAPAAEPVGVDAVQLARDVVLAEQEFRRSAGYLSGETAESEGRERGLSDWAKGLGWGAFAAAAVTPWGTLGKLGRLARSGDAAFDVVRAAEGVSGAGEGLVSGRRAADGMGELLELAGGGGAAGDAPLPSARSFDDLDFSKVFTGPTEAADVFGYSENAASLSRPMGVVLRSDIDAGRSRFFHSTSPENVESVLREGLRPSLWEDAPGDIGIFASTRLASPSGMGSLGGGVLEFNVNNEGLVSVVEFVHDSSDVIRLPDGTGWHLVAPADFPEAAKNINPDRIAAVHTFRRTGDGWEFVETLPVNGSLGSVFEDYGVAAIPKIDAPKIDAPPSNAMDIRGVPSLSSQPFLDDLSEGGYGSFWGVTVKEVLGGEPADFEEALWGASLLIRDNLGSEAAKLVANDVSRAFSINNVGMLDDSGRLIVSGFDVGDFPVGVDSVGRGPFLFDYVTFSDDTFFPSSSFSSEDLDRLFGIRTLRGNLRPNSGANFVEEVYPLLDEASPTALMEQATKVQVRFANLLGDMYGDVDDDYVLRLLNRKSEATGSALPEWLDASPSYGLLAPKWMRRNYVRVSGAVDEIYNFAKYNAAAAVNLMRTPEAVSVIGEAEDFVPVSVAVARLWDVLRLAFEPKLSSSLGHAAGASAGSPRIVWAGDFNYDVVKVRLGQAIEAVRKVDLAKERTIRRDLSLRGVRLPAEFNYPLNVPQEFEALAGEIADVNSFAGAVARVIMGISDNAFKAAQASPLDDLQDLDNVVFDGLEALDLLRIQMNFASDGGKQFYIKSMLETPKETILGTARLAEREALDEPFKPFYSATATSRGLGDDIPVFDETGPSASVGSSSTADSFASWSRFQNRISSSPFIRQFDSEIARYGSASDLSNKILSFERDIDSAVAAVVYWQRKGNENIQSILRHGVLPDDSSTLDAIEQLSRNRQMTVDEVAEALIERSERAVDYLDEMIDASTSHGGFVAYRGITARTASKMFGDTGYRNIMMNNDTDGALVPIAGRYFEEPGFLAFTLSPQRARGFSSNTGIIFKVEVPEGFPALSINGHLDEFTPPFPGEFEFLLPRGARVNFDSMITSRDLRNAGAESVPRSTSGAVDVKWNSIGNFFEYVNPNNGRAMGPVSAPVIRVTLEY